MIWCSWLQSSSGFCSKLAGRDKSSGLDSAGQLHRHGQLERLTPAVVEKQPVEGGADLLTGLPRLAPEERRGPHRSAQHPLPELCTGLDPMVERDRGDLDA